MSSKKKPTWGQSKTVIAALDYIGSHRKTGTRPRLKSCPVSVRTANKLAKMRWAMWVGDYVMLTYEGERRWTARYPHSKYRIK